MSELTGISASPGIVVGTAYLHIEESQTVPRYDIRLELVPTEVNRFEQAVAKAIEEIEILKSEAAGDLQTDEITLLDTHLLMLSDPDFAHQIRLSLAEQLQNVEYVLVQYMRSIMAKLSEIKDDYLRERTADVHDVSKRVLNHLLFRERRSLGNLTHDVVVVSHDLLPSEFIAMDKRRVKGIALDVGGRTSHTAILARAFEIPAVLGLSEVTKLVQSGDRIVIDGNHGRVVISPDAATEARFNQLLREWHRREVDLMRLNELPAETRDGKVIRLKANIEVPEEVDAADAHGADGIGLYRSEFLFLRSGGLPGEDEQCDAYRRVLEAMDGRPVTIRTLDIGGDKLLPAVQDEGEKNPILGFRAIRFCLTHEELFLTQLRALLRASVAGNLRIMFPMISGMEELERALELVDVAKEQLRRDHLQFADDIDIGIMIEVPSAALTADILATKSDFFSIGTNDLIQYTIAVDRGNEHVAYLYEPFHPAVLRSLKMVIENAHQAGLPAGMCGEMAGDPLNTVVLLGLGLDEFSMSAASIPEVKRIIRSTTVHEAEELVGRIMTMASYRDIDRFVRSFMEERFAATITR